MNKICFTHLERLDVSAMNSIVAGRLSEYPCPRGPVAALLPFKGRSEGLLSRNRSLLPPEGTCSHAKSIAHDQAARSNTLPRSCRKQPHCERWGRCGNGKRDGRRRWCPSRPGGALASSAKLEVASFQLSATEGCFGCRSHQHQEGREGHLTSSCENSLTLIAHQHA